MKPVKLYVVMPCYNEEAVLPETVSRMLELFSSMEASGIITKTSRIVFVDDGSKDKTRQLISE